MPIEYRQGDIFASGCEALVNPVDCIGAMGAGLAKEFKQRFPENFKEYKAACMNDWIGLGHTYWVQVHNKLPTRWIVNFPTKNHWRENSRLEWIVSGLDHLAIKMNEWPSCSIAIPALGCGLGGLAWPDVRKCIEDRLSARQDVLVLVYEPRVAFDD